MIELPIIEGYYSVILNVSDDIHEQSMSMSLSHESASIVGNELKKFADISGEHTLNVWIDGDNVSVAIGNELVCF